MDSCVCAALAAPRSSSRCLARELRAAHRTTRAAIFPGICDRLNIHDKLLVRNEALRAIGGSALTDEKIAVPTAPAADREIPVTYVPFRNAHFLSVAVSWAEVLGAEKIYIGAVEA